MTPELKGFWFIAGILVIVCIIAGVLIYKQSEKDTLRESSFEDKVLYRLDKLIDIEEKDLVKPRYP